MGGDGVLACERAAVSDRGPYRRRRWLRPAAYRSLMRLSEEDGENIALVCRKWRRRQALPVCALRVVGQDARHDLILTRREVDLRRGEVSMSEHPLDVRQRHARGRPPCAAPPCGGGHGGSIWSPALVGPLEDPPHGCIGQRPIRRTASQPQGRPTKRMRLVLLVQPQPDQGVR